MPVDPLIPVDRAGLVALLQMRAMSEKELARRVGISHQSVASLFRAPANRPGAKERIRLSRARALAAALGVVVDSSTGEYMEPVYVDEDITGYLHVATAVTVLDAGTVRNLVAPEHKGREFNYLTALDAWRPDGTVQVPIEDAVAFSRHWVELALLIKKHAGDEARAAFADAALAFGQTLMEMERTRHAPTTAP